ncbi:serine/threonine protein kinase [Colletotrichum simmondsii]|uniref:Serine/threonine protein kinase n=1 Tax=Colletotrichum simmondsii TaxID=703756 RepID=A0A135SEJ7_9PEZI|nr:serine/threonine protein kinase [Colletotrichum simmondsii]
MSNFNIPFINLKRPDIRRANIEFYINQIHPDYDTCDRVESQGKEVFRKVHAYQYRISSEKERIAEAKREILVAHKMSRQHRSVAKLLFAFFNIGSSYEIIELVFEKYNGNLENLLLGPYLPQDLMPHAGDRSELIDHILWKEMMNVVEAVMILHTFRSFSNPLDLKPANILVGEDKRGRLTLHLADFGHVVETEPRRATVDYAPPGDEDSEGLGSENETGMTYDVWSIACILLRILIFIQGRCQKSELELFDSNRQAEFVDAAYWCRHNGTFALRTTVGDALALLENQKEEGTKLIASTLRQMFNIQPEERGTMDSCHSALRKAKQNNRPKDQDAMECGCEDWSVSYRNRLANKEFPAHLAVYRDRRQQTTYYNPSEETQEESISIDLDVEMEIHLNRGIYSDISFSPAAYFPPENDDQTNSKMIWLKSILSDYTLLFTDIKEYRQFIALITRQEIIPKDETSAQTDFTFRKCSITANKHTFMSGRLHIWKRLTERDYDTKFKRSASATPVSYVPDSENRQTYYKLVLWTRRESNKQKVCVIVDIGETTWKLARGEGASELMILPKRELETMFKSQLRASIYEEQTDPGRTPEKYPFIPIDPVQMEKGLKKGVVKDLHIHFTTSKGKSNISTQISHLQKVANSNTDKDP